jgi:putative zinc finger/helix-turn-helix YgiT family protein
MRCDICNTETKVTKEEKYKYTLSGLDNLYLKNIKVERCKKCDLDVPYIPKIIRLHDTIARAIVLKSTLLKGEEMRFLRKNLLIKAQDWAKLLRKDVATISRAEKDGNVLNKDLDLLVRLLYVRIWEEANVKFFDEKVTELVVIIDGVEINILIDVDQIEDFSYFESEDFWVNEIKLNALVYESMSDFGSKAIFGESDFTPKQTPSFEGESIYNYAKNSELALAG